MKKQHSSKWQQWFLIGLCSLIVAIGGCWSRTQAPMSLTVAVEPVYAPFEFRGSDGSLQGFDIDLIRAIGTAAGFEVNFQTIAFDGMIPALQARTVAAAIGAMTITPQRAQAVDFSRPYFKAGLAIAVRTGTQGIRTLEDLQGKTIAVQIGTTGAEAVKPIPNAKIRTFNASVLALQELSNGNVDAVVNDAPVTLYAIKTGNLKSVEIAGELLSEEFYGIPTAKNSPYLPFINQGLGKILETGTYRQIYQKWFNAEPPALPDSIAAVIPATAQSSTRPLQIVFNSLPLLLAGTVVTIALTAISSLLGLIGGSLLGILRLSPNRWLRWSTRAYIDFFRGTPLLVQIFMIYFGIPAVLQEFGLAFGLDRFLAAVMALSLNSAAYTAEIVRGGIQSIDRGQKEAAKALGLNKTQTMRHVIFPQALRRMLAPLGNQFISLLKDTSLVAVIGFEELFRQGQLIVATNYRPFELYATIALIYLGLTLLSSLGFGYLERWLHPDRRIA